MATSGFLNSLIHKELSLETSTAFKKIGMISPGKLFYRSYFKNKFYKKQMLSKRTDMI
jgi:hypothetical protein